MAHLKAKLLISVIFDRWECIFLPDSGAFFVNYVITAAMIGAGLELIRFPELFWYTIQICWSRSKAETMAIQV